MTAPKYMAFDEYKNIMVWTDTGLQQVSYAPVDLDNKEAQVNKTDRYSCTHSLTHSLLLTHTHSLTHSS